MVGLHDICKEGVKRLTRWFSFGRASSPRNEEMAALKTAALQPDSLQLALQSGREFLRARERRSECRASVENGGPLLVQQGLRGWLQNDE